METMIVAIRASLCTMSTHIRDIFRFNLETQARILTLEEEIITLRGELAILANEQYSHYDYESSDE